MKGSDKLFSKDEKFNVILYVKEDKVHKEE